MNEAVGPVMELVSVLSASLGPDFQVMPGPGFVVVVSPDYGLAAVVGDPDRTAAIKAVAVLSQMAKGAGHDVSITGFSKATGDREPFTWREGPLAAVDIAAGMARASAGRPGLTPDVIASLGSLLAVKVPSPAAPVTGMKLSPYMSRLAEACIEKALAGAPALVADVEIDARDMAAANFMLPALLVDAATSWTVPVVARGGKGGFLVKMKQDRNAILGFTVTGLDASAPLLLFLPMVNLVRRSIVKGECVLDESVRRFQHFLSANGIEGILDEDVDVRVASTT